MDLVIIVCNLNSFGVRFGFCELGNELSGSEKGREFVDGVNVVF
jgi:hypothetical protein